MPLVRCTFAARGPRSLSSTIGSVLSAPVAWGGTCGPKTRVPGDGHRGRVPPGDRARDPSRSGGRRNHGDGSGLGDPACRGDGAASHPRVPRQDRDERRRRDPPGPLGALPPPRSTPARSGCACSPAPSRTPRSVRITDSRLTVPARSGSTRGFLARAPFTIGGVTSTRSVGFQLVDTDSSYIQQWTSRASSGSSASASGAAPDEPAGRPPGQRRAALERALRPRPGDRASGGGSLVLGAGARDRHATCTSRCPTRPEHQRRAAVERPQCGRLLDVARGPCSASPPGSTPASPSCASRARPVLAGPPHAHQHRAIRHPGAPERRQQRLRRTAVPRW